MRKILVRKQMSSAGKRPQQMTSHSLKEPLEVLQNTESTKDKMSEAHPT